MSESINHVRIRDTATRQAPKPHVVYEVEVRGPVRTWTMWKRYSEFEELNKKFQRLFPNHGLPVDLPSKHFLQSTLGNPLLVEERKHGLEEYMRGILTARDDRWRETDEWKEFLAIPTGRALDPSSMYTSESWLDDYNQVQALTREIRSLLNRRDTHNSRNEIQASHNCGMQAKRSLEMLSKRIGSLETGLQGMARTSGVMSEGELRRRKDMLADIKDEKDTLAKLVIIGRPDGNSTGPASSTDRAALLRQPIRQRSLPNIGRTAGSGFGVTALPHAQRPASSRRVFGNAHHNQPVETEQTRGLDNDGILKLQQQTMTDQDSHVEQFSALLSRQRHIGHAINQELEVQNSLLAGLEDQVDQTGLKLRMAQNKIANIR